MRGGLWNRAPVKHSRPCTLLGLNQACGALHTDDQTARDFRVKGAAVTRLFNAKDSLDPGNNLVRRRVSRLVQINETSPDVIMYGSLEWIGAMWQRCVVSRPDVQFIKILQQ